MSADEMTVETVEVVGVMSAADAAACAEKITAELAVVNESTGALVESIADALTGRAWIALGHGSWDELCSARGWEFRPRTSTDRAELARLLRESGMSFRAIGRLVGVSEATAHRDLSGVTDVTPAEITGTDGKTYPSRPAAAAAAADIGGDDLADGEAEAIADALDDADIELTPENVGQGVDDAIESRELPDPPKPPIIKPDLGDGISHPARYSNAILERFAEVIVGLWGEREHMRVLDPFAGTGRIHDLPATLPEAFRSAIHTTGVEIEPEWAAMREGTVIGSALCLPFNDETFDVVATSPTYGNRLADSHNASDPHLRRSYTHDLGRPLDDDSSGDLQWGPRYRTFHTAAWTEAARVLRPGGHLLLNIKDHVRGGEQQPVAAWHTASLTRLGLDLDAAISTGVSTQHLRQGSTPERAGQELVLVFIKPGGDR